MFAGWQYLTAGDQINWFLLMIISSVCGLGALGALAAMLAPPDATKKKQEDGWAPIAFGICLMLAVLCFKGAMAIWQEAFLLENMCRH